MSLDIYLYMPDTCPDCGGKLRSGDELFWQNITHNVIPMWNKAGVYDALYESEGKTVTPEYISTIQTGVATFERDYPEFEKLNAPNGWGLAKHALPWLKHWLNACERNIGATIRVSR